MPKPSLSSLSSPSTTSPASDGPGDADVFVPIRGTAPPLLRLPETGFLRQPQVLAFVPISAATLWRRVQQRTFPQPVKLSAGITAWRAEDIRRWISGPHPPG